MPSRLRQLPQRLRIQFLIWVQRFVVFCLIGRDSFDLFLFWFIVYVILNFALHSERIAHKLTSPLGPMTVCTEYWSISKSTLASARLQYPHGNWAFDMFEHQQFLSCWSRYSKQQQWWIDMWKWHAGKCTNHMEEKEGTSRPWEETVFIRITFNSIYVHFWIYLILFSLALRWKRFRKMELSS